VPFAGRVQGTSKLGIVLEEADESLFWLELLQDSGVVEPDKISAKGNKRTGFDLCGFAANSQGFEI
jgi:hypothetical protein